jgi:hypothetical protein
MLPRLRLIGINLLIAAVLVLVAIEAIPQSPRAVRAAVQPLTRRIGLAQSWNLFVPPDMVNTRLRAEITYADGQTAQWRSPDWPALSPARRFVMHRRSEWLDNIWGTSNSPALSPALTSWARYLAQSERPDLPHADAGAEVKIIIEQAPIPSADVVPWTSWHTPSRFDESTTLAIEKLP